MVLLWEAGGEVRALLAFEDLFEGGVGTNSLWEVDCGHFCGASFDKVTQAS